ncbi:MAG: glycosyltransferase [Bacteroidales bacterium]|nr:glycosyltransferase [Bacteroidales bacterium]
MKILHINTYQSGGAALCMQRIGNALQQQNVECRYLLMDGNNNDITSIDSGDTNFWSKNTLLFLLQKTAYIIGIKPKIIKLKQRLAKTLYENKEHIFTTLPLSYNHSLTSHPWVKEADIIHIHWIGNFVDFPSFFKNIKKPIVWTLHDLNPLLGCFHYLDSNQKASSQLLAIEKKCINIKHKALSNRNNINIVAISKQMQKAISANKTLGKYPITLINNGVDTEKYIPYDKKTSRKELNIPNEMIVFMFSSSFLDDTHKGLKELINALEAAKIRNIFLLCIGNYREIPQTTFPIRCTGYISDENLLSKYYSAADYFVMPSFQESFGQTTTEALSCGTPVIAFPCGIAVDIIDEKLGVICKDFTSEALLEAIKLAITRNYDRKEIRQKTIDKLSYNNIAKQYINLYKNILNNNKYTENNKAFSKLNYDIINQQKTEHKRQLELFSQLDQRRNFYKMALTHPRYIAGWIKKEIKNLK